MKKEKRKQLKLLRDSVKDRASLDLKITERFLTSDIYKHAKAILMYYSVGSEVSTCDILTQALKDKKTVAFPVCIDDKGIMKFYIVESENDFQVGMYGIKSPVDTCKEFIASDNAVCIVPGLSFDNEGYRIGYGKGYYDRYLASFIGTTVGICYDQLLCDSLPHDCYDKKVNYLITDKKTYKFKSIKEDLKNG